MGEGWVMKFEGASMEPWHFSHGEIAYATATIATEPLQWSHGILAMESA